MNSTQRGMQGSWPQLCHAIRQRDWYLPSRDSRILRAGADIGKETLYMHIHI